MQRTRFDDIARRLTASTSRRAALRSLIGAAAGLATPVAVDAGRRRTSCASGLTRCQTRRKRICVDLATNPRHCGACRHRCATDETCVAGACSAPCGVCVVADPSTCGTDGQCVNGTCSRYGQGVECRPPSCSGAMRQQASVCDGNGACLAGARAACPNNLRCQDAVSCFERCDHDDDCVAGFQCDMSKGSCVPKPPPP